MSYNSMYYWKNFLENDKETVVKPNSYVLNLQIINQNTSDIFYKWYAFDTKEEVTGFLKFVVLPSGYYSRIFGKEDDDVVVTADYYDSVLELLYNNIVKVDQTLIDNYRADYDLIEEAEKNFSMALINEFCHSFNTHLNHKEIVFSSIYVYESIKEYGKQLIASYEEDGMIDQLELQMELSRDEIETMFMSIDSNPFMLRKINDFLNSKIML